eukprot:6325229-Amphidinium_carterae.1
MERSREAMLKQQYPGRQHPHEPLLKKQHVQMCVTHGTVSKQGLQRRIKDDHERGTRVQLLMLFNRPHGRK